MPFQFPPSHCSNWVSIRIYECSRALRGCRPSANAQTFAIWAAIFMKMNDWMTIKLCSLPYIQLPHANRKLSLWQHKMFLKTHEYLSDLYWQCFIELPHCNYLFAFLFCPRARYQWTLGSLLGNKLIHIWLMLLHLFVQVVLLSDAVIKIGVSVIRDGASH